MYRRCYEIKKCAEGAIRLQKGTEGAIRLQKGAGNLIITLTVIQRGLKNTQNDYKSSQLEFTLCV